MSNISTGNKINVQDNIKQVSDSIELIKSATKNPHKGKVNEQELFASFVHQQLADRKPNIAEKFMKSFENKLNELKDAGENNKILRAVRQALKKLVRQDNVLTQTESLNIRRYAIGMAQLDDDKTLLSTKANQDNPSNSPVMKISSSLGKNYNSSKIKKIFIIEILSFSFFQLFNYL